MKKEADESWIKWACSVHEKYNVEWKKENFNVAHLCEVIYDLTKGKDASMQIEPGDRVKDMISNVEGVVVGITHYLTGCVHVGIERPLMQDGKLPDWYWTDIRRCVVLAKKVVSLEDDKEFGKHTETSGGPSQCAPDRR